MTEDAKFFIELSAKIVEDNLDKIIAGVASPTRKVIGSIKARTLASFKRYFESAVNKYIATKTILNTQEPVSLYDIYVGLDIVVGKRSVPATDLQSILNISPHVILSGLAGSGKSTLLKHLFLSSIKERRQLPLFVELRYLQNIDDGAIDKFIESIIVCLGNLNLDIASETLEAALLTGRLVLFLDGFDELPTKTQAVVEKLIIAFRDKYHKNGIIISSRPSERFAAWTNFTELQVAELSKEKVLSLIDKINYDPDIKALFRSKVDDLLYDRHRSFLSNPLLLTIMLITFSQYADIPERLHLFYEQAFDALYFKHDATKAGFKRTRNCDLPYDSFKSILSCLCFQSYYNNMLEFREDVVLGYLSNAKKVCTNVEFDERCFLADLLQAVCILTIDGLEYLFTHRSFQEYFAAVFIVSAKSDFKPELLGRISDRMGRDSVWHLLFDMDRKGIEQMYFFKAMPKIIASVPKEQDKERYIFTSMFSHFIIKKEEIVSLQISNIRVFDLYYFCVRNYRGIFRKEIVARAATMKPSQLIAILEGEGIRLGKDGRVPIAKIVENEKAVTIFWDLMSHHLADIAFFMKLPDLIQEEDRESKEAIESIFRRA